jgi:hypothetical protein
MADRETEALPAPRQTAKAAKSGANGPVKKAPPAAEPEYEYYDYDEGPPPPVKKAPPAAEPEYEYYDYDDNPRPPPKKPPPARPKNDADYDAQPSRARRPPAAAGKKGHSYDDEEKPVAAKPHSRDVPVRSPPPIDDEAEKSPSVARKLRRTLAAHTMSREKAKLEAAMGKMMLDDSVKEQAKYKAALERNAKLIRDYGRLRPVRAHNREDPFVVERIKEAIAMTQEMVKELSAEAEDDMTTRTPRD